MEPPPELDFRASSPEFAPRRRSASQTSQPPAEDARYPGSVQANLTKLVWEASSQQVKQAFNWYTNIDLFRPYFDVEPKQVRNRLLLSLLPRKPSTMQMTQYDLYGPLMLIFTLIAILHYIMKSSGYKAEDGTLIGSAMFTCFGYWAFSSISMYTTCYIFATNITFLTVTSMMGYALFGHCVILLLTTLFHPEHGHIFFYALVLLFAVTSCIRVGIYLAYKTPEKGHKLILAALVCLLHLGFIMYLHFGYHKVVEELDTMLHPSGLHLTKGVPVAAAKGSSAVG